MTKQALLIFSKNPEAGKVKTRLAATIGEEAALNIYNRLLLRTVAATEFLSVDKFVFYSNRIEEKDVWDTKHYFKKIQQGNDLGERMQNAFTLLFEMGYHKIVIIGTDCPDLSAEIVLDAFVRLKAFDVAIGPAEDGGYYLLGMKELHGEIFEGMQWSTNTVLEDTIKKFISLRLNYHLLPVLKDIDEEKDLDAFKMQRQ